MEILSIRLKGQLAENSKILSYYSTFPEHNHNEIEGWNKLENLTSQFSVLWLKDENDNVHIKKRMEIVKKLTSKISHVQLDLKTDGESTIERVFSMIHFIDWISFYLAMSYKVNPSPVNNIMKLKSLMSEK
jgi:glucose/mannose-6-phosphate isomerase